MSSEPRRLDTAPQADRLDRVERAFGADSFRRGVLAVSGGTLVSMVVLLVEAVLVARTLPVADMGAYVLFQVILSLMIIAVDLGFKTAAAQFIPGRPDAQQARTADSLIALRLIVLGAISVPLLPAAAPLARILQVPRLAELMAFLPPILLFASLEELLGGMLQGFQRYKHLALASVVRSLLRLALSCVALFVLAWGLRGLAISWLLSFGVSAAIQWFAIPTRRRFRVDWTVVRQVLHFGLPLQLTRYLWFATQRFDVFVLTVLIGPVGVAFYDVAGRLPQGLQRLLEAYDAVYHPTLASRFTSHDLAGSERLIERSLRLFIFATLFVAWGAVLFGKDLIVLLFKDRYAEAASAFVILLIAFSLSSSSNLLGYALTAYGRPGKSFSVSLLRAVASVGGAFLLIPAFGFIGAAYARLLSQLASLPLAWWCLRRERLSVFWSVHLRQFLLTGGIAAAYFLLPPLSLGARLILLGIWPLLTIVVPLISFDDLTLVIPRRLMPRPGLIARALGQSGGTKD